MFLFWITTIICTVSSGASLKAVEPSGAIMPLASGFLDREQIHVQVLARLQKFDGLLQLLVETVVERHGGVAGRPAVRNQRAVLRAVVLELAAARAACGNPGRW